MNEDTHQTFRTRITLLQKIQRRHDENARKEFSGQLLEIPLNLGVLMNDLLRIL